jgi:hypothetical protein
MGEGGQMNNAEFNRNWDWQLKHIEQIKEILRSQAMHIVKIDIASPENDMKYATDLEVHVTGGDIAVRIRRDIPWRDLTIRAKNGNARTEIHKLRDGYADWYLYAWTINDLVSDWMLIDLNVMRNKGCFDENRPIIMNKDSFTGFVKYSLQELKSYNAVVATNITEGEH